RDIDGAYLRRRPPPLPRPTRWRGFPCLRPDSQHLRYALGGHGMPNRQRDFPKANARAKRLRRDLTPAEERFRKLLRRKIEGCHFRCQAPIGPYVFDFAEMRHRLLVELDGGIHDLPQVDARDRVKDAWAIAQGFRVLRIPNVYVFGTGEPALAMVMQALRTSPV